MYIKCIISENEFDEVKDEWIAFEKKVFNRNITASYFWQRTWWKHFKDYKSISFGHNKKLCILLLYSEENVLRAIAPFCEVIRGVPGLKCRTIEFIAQQWGGTYLDIISDKLNDEEYNYIFDWLKNNRKFDFIELKFIPDFSPNFKLNGKGISVLSACPEVGIKDYKEVKEYIQNEYSKSIKKNLKTAKNRMNRENINYQEESLDFITDNDFNAIENISRSKLKDNKHCIYDNPRKRDFLKDTYSNLEFPHNLIKIILNNRLASYRINYLYNNCKYCFDASYDRTYRHYDLGALSVDLNIRDSFKRKLLNHCMGTGVDSYKFKFTSKIIKIYIFLNPGNSFKGIIFYNIAKLRNQIIETMFNRQMRKIFVQE